MARVKVQATREEVVDELTVQLTNARKAYLEALLMFADEPTLFPAAPLARRRHLFQRMLLISREAVMSSRRIVSSFAAASAWSCRRLVRRTSRFRSRRTRGRRSHRS